MAKDFDRSLPYRAAVFLAVCHWVAAKRLPWLPLVPLVPRCCPFLFGLAVSLHETLPAKHDVSICGRSTQSLDTIQNGKTLYICLCLHNAYICPINNLMYSQTKVQVWALRKRRLKIPTLVDETSVAWLRRPTLPSIQQVFAGDARMDRPKASADSDCKANGFFL